MMIWCVEDDASIRDLEIYTLQSMGFDARGFGDGSEMAEALKEELPDLVLLDIMLPGKDGVEILQELRANPQTAKLPVIMATAKGQEYDKVQSLDLGADDYLAKPFGMLEMVSRIRAVLRRCGNVDESKVYRVEGLMLDEGKRTVMIDDSEVKLTYKEFELLRLFLSRPSMVFTRETLFAEVWGESYVGETRTIDMHIRTLRQKLGSYGKLIKTVRNVGYKLEVKNY